MAETSSFPEDLRTIVLNYKEPFLIKRTLNWDILQWDLQRWSTVLNGEVMECRCGKYDATMEPQWERHTAIVKKSFDEFLNLDVKENKEWLYFDYKYLRDYFKNRDVLRNSISWEIHGFPEYNSEDSTLWIGSEGAHTPCHKDTYGCNLIAQIYGRKRWIMFPPEEDLHPTRIPYEESSVYSKLNFFSPNNLDAFESIKICKMIVLEPGDVLYVPNGWWHYVENLEMAISVNIWIPLCVDSENQLKEALVQMFISQIVKDLDDEKRKEVLNPNMEKLNLEMQNIMSSLDVVNLCKDNVLKMSQPDNVQDIKKLFEKHAIKLHKIPDLSNKEFKSVLQMHASRFKEDGSNISSKLESSCGMLSSLINAYTSDDVVNLVVKKLLSNKI